MELCANSKNALVIGGKGFLGYGIVRQLSSSGWNVRCLDRDSSNTSELFSEVQYVSGDMFDANVLSASLENINIVFYLLSTTIPRSNDYSLDNEIKITLGSLDYLLKMMSKCGVNKIVFPSSGGAAYGGKEDGMASESDELVPQTAYGAGKALSEQVIRYYYRKSNINALILRIGNVYGYPFYRSQLQGVIDVFIQNALVGKPITVWGNATRVIRDYIHLNDVARAVEMVANKDITGVSVYNVATGVGTTVKTIIECISDVLEIVPVINYATNISSGVDRIVLSINKISEEVGWHPRYDLVTGIRKTIIDKKKLIY